MEESDVQVEQAKPVAYVKKEECGLAIASVICGGLSFFFGMFTALPAVICGHMALADFKRNPGKYDNSAKTMSIIGLVLGYVFIGLSVLAVLVFIMIFVVAAGAA